MWIMCNKRWLWRGLSIGLGFGMSTMLITGCGVVSQGFASEKTTAGDKAYTQDSKAMVQKLERSDTPENVTEELLQREKQKIAKANTLLTVTSDGLLLHHKYGDTLLPNRPKRIAVIRLEDPVLALGVTPVAAHTTPEFYLNDRLQAMGVQDISINETTKTVNLEQVQAAKPDIILLRDSFDKATYDALSKIAPVAVLNLQDSETTLLVLGNILGKEKEALLRLEAYYHHVSTARQAIKSRIGHAPVALVRILNKEVRLYPYSANAINRFMYELLNLVPEPLAVIGDRGSTNVVSLEQLPSLSAEYLIVSAGYGPSSHQKNDTARRRFQELQEDPLWKLIPAVRDGHVIEVDSTIWNAHGIIAKEMAMTELAKALEK